MEQISNLARLSKHLARLGPLVNSEAFVAGLVDMLRDFVVVDEVSIISYPPEALPVIEYRDKDVPTTRQNLDTFIQGAFVLDPYYVAACRYKNFGFFTLQELAPSGFHLSEYYRSYYRHAGLEDECGYLLATASGGMVNISLAQVSKLRQFTEHDIKMFRELGGAVAGICAQHAFGHEVAEHSVLRLEIDSAMESFGSNLLTRRESEIISMILHGHAGKNIAADLGISLETVKLHRRNAYSKLQVKSQAELFYAFISSLASLGVK